MEPYVFFWQASSLLVDISKLAKTLAFAWNCLIIITNMDKGYMLLYS